MNFEQVIAFRRIFHRKLPVCVPMFNAAHLKRIKSFHGFEQPHVVLNTVKSFGMFVELDDMYVEGLVHISTLSDDYYQFDSTRMLLEGELSGTKYRLGDSVDIIVTRVDIDERKIDFVLEQNKNPNKRKRAKKPTKKLRHKK